MEILIFALYLAIILGWIRLGSYFTERRERRESKRRYFNYCRRIENQMSSDQKIAKEIFLFASKLRYGEK